MTLEDGRSAATSQACGERGGDRGRGAAGLDQRTEFAADRTILAAERTYAAWVRTGLAFLASGVGARALLAAPFPGWFGALAGTFLVLFSMLCFTAAIWRTAIRLPYSSSPDILAVPPVILLIANGFLIVVDAIAILGIWITS